MRKAIYSGPNRSGTCMCGHRWDKHRLGVVATHEKAQTDGDYEAYVPQECGYYGFDGMGGLDREGEPHCLRYRDTLDHY